MNEWTTDKTLKAVEALITAIENRNHTSGHSLRVARYSAILGREVGLDPQALERLQLGALLHDIGQISFPDVLIQTPLTSLTSDDTNLIRSHTSRGAELLARWPGLEFAVPYALCHQEWLNGTGYPNQLRRDQIPFEVQVLSVADVYEALRHPRKYRSRGGLSRQESIRVLNDLKGKRWIPELVDRFLEISDDW
jgi:putative nucleotidyltransferase with HDIG domain